MKIKGKKIEGPNIEIIVIPRTDQDIVFKAQAVLDMSEFDRLCPLPKPPQIMKRNVGLVDDIEDPFYKEQIKQHNQRRVDWIIIQSLKATEDLEWETVKYGDASTWSNYRQELKDSGFGEYEINRIFAGVMIANSLDEKKMEEARERFLRGQALERERLSSLKEEQNSMLNGKLVSASVSDPQG